MNSMTLRQIVKLVFFLLFVFFLRTSPLQAKLTIGVVFYDPPLVFSAKQGFNIDLVKKICSGLKEDCTIVNLEWNRLFTELDNGSIDILVGAYITPKRAEKYLFTTAYLPSLGRFMGLSTRQLKSIDQLKGMHVGIIKEEAETGVFHNYIALTYPNFFNLVDYKDISSLIEALSLKSVDAAIVNNNAVNYWIVNSNNKFDTIGPTFTIGDGLAMLTLPQNKELVANLNAQLSEIKKNGDFEEIYNNYF